MLTPEQYGIAGMLMAALAGNIAGLWYSARAYNDMKNAYIERLKEVTDDRNAYRELVLQLLPINHEALKLAGRAATKRQGS